VGFPALLSGMAETDPAAHSAAPATIPARTNNSFFMAAGYHGPAGFQAFTTSCCRRRSTIHLRELGGRMLKKVEKPVTRTTRSGYFEGSA